MFLLVCLVVTGLIASSSCVSGEGVTGFGDDALSSAAILPLPQQRQSLEPELVRVGERLFFDPRISGNQAMSCAVCHSIEGGGDDDKRHSLDPNGVPRTVNTPTVLNVAHNYIVGWTGKFPSVKDLSAAVLCSQKAMGSDWDQILSAVRSDPEYSKSFETLLERDITREVVLEALDSYQASLTTPDAPFDSYLRGDKDAVSKEAVAGYHLFQSYGCIACHQGKNIGGNIFQEFGLFGDYFTDNGRVMTEADLGRFNVTGDEADRHVFRVPSLRNVARTAPYFHDGSKTSLEDAVRCMAEYQLGRMISEEDVMRIVAFLSTLSGSVGGGEL